MSKLLAGFSRRNFIKDIGFNLPPLTLLTALILFIFPSAKAQNSGPQNACITATNTLHGVDFENSCPFRVHIYWVFTDDPNRVYNNYIESGGTHETLHKGNVDYYTCASGYFVVDQWGNVITHQVSGYGCKK